MNRSKYIQIQFLQFQWIVMNNLRYFEQRFNFPENSLPNFAATEKTLLLQSDFKEALKNEKNISAFNQEKKK
jgi:hypothetical protein